MAILNQNETSLTYYSGWYGTCKNECEPFDLLNIEGSTYSYKYDSIYAIYATSTNNQGLVSYKGTYTMSLLIKNLPIKQLECGTVYRIILKKGNGSIDIPGFVFSSHGTDNPHRLTENCGGEPSGYDENKIFPKVSSPIYECCADASNIYAVSYFTRKFEDNVTTMPFKFSGELCFGEILAGFPSSTKFYLNHNNEKIYLGSVAMFGKLKENTEVKFTIDDVKYNDIEKYDFLKGKCLTGIINLQGICVLDA